MALIAWPDDVIVEATTFALIQPHKAIQITDDGVSQQKRRGASRWLIRTAIHTQNTKSGIVFFNAISEANCVVDIPLTHAMHGFSTIDFTTVASRITEEDGLISVRFVTPENPPEVGDYLYIGSSTFRRIYQILAIRIDGANTIARVGPNIRPRGVNVRPIASISARLATVGDPPWGRLETVGMMLSSGSERPRILSAPFSVEWNEVPG